jgi:hypothetical protein
LKSADGLLDIGRDAGIWLSFKSGDIGFARSDKADDLVVQISDLVFEKLAKFKLNTNRFLVVVLILQSLGLVLTLAELLLESTSWGKFVLVGKIGRLVQHILQAELNNQTKLQMLWVQGSRGQVGRNVIGYQVLKFIRTASQSLILELRSQVAGVVVALAKNLSRSKLLALGQLRSQIVA